MEALIELLSNTEKAGIVMQSLADYIIYIYPGIISIYILHFLEAKTTKSTQAFVVKCFAISYVYNIFLQSLLVYDENKMTYNIFLLIVSVVLPGVWYKFKYSKLLSRLCGIFHIRTCVTGVPLELMKDEEEKYTCLKVYLKDNFTAYTGYMDEYEYEDGFEKFIILSSYKKYNCCNAKEEKLVISHLAKQCDEKVLIKYDEVKVIEKIAEKRANTEIYKTVS